MLGEFEMATRGDRAFRILLLYRLVDVRALLLGAHRRRGQYLGVLHAVVDVPHDVGHLVPCHLLATLRRTQVVGRHTVSRLPRSRLG